MLEFYRAHPEHLFGFRHICPYCGSTQTKWLTNEGDGTEHVAVIWLCISCENEFDIRETSWFRSNDMPINAREESVKSIQHRWSDVTDIKFHCDGCPAVTTCEYAFDEYNAYTEDGKIADTGCLMDK